MPSIMKGLTLFCLVLQVFSAAVIDVSNTVVVGSSVDIVQHNVEVTAEVEKFGSKVEQPGAVAKAAAISEILSEALDTVPEPLVPRAASYSLRCNGNNIPVEVIWKCAVQIRLLKPPQIVWNRNLQAFWCSRYYGEPTIAVYGLSYDDKEHRSDGSRVADAVERIIKECGTRGGSVQTADDPNFIVHVNNYED